MTGILDMTLEGVGEMFRGYSAETCTVKIPLVPMGVRAEGPGCADTGARTPIGTSEIPYSFYCGRLCCSSCVDFLVFEGVRTKASPSAATHKAAQALCLDQYVYKLVLLYSNCLSPNT